VRTTHYKGGFFIGEQVRNQNRPGNTGRKIF